VAPCDTLRPDSCHISMGHQVSSLTPCDTLRPNDHHISRGHQVPSLTPCDTFCLDGHHILIGVFLSKKVLVDILARWLEHLVFESSR